jgi:hypothetical protein
MSLAATMERVERGRFAAEIQAAPRATTAPTERRWMVEAFCPLTGPWRQVVHATTASGALVRYCAEHDLPPDNCQVRPHC